MRTTLALDDDVLEAARALARQQGSTLGAVISGLARESLRSPARGSSDVERERQGLKVLPFPVDFQARGRWAGPLWRDPSQWLPSVRALDDSSRALRELLGRLVYRSW